MLRRAVLILAFAGCAHSSPPPPGEERLVKVGFEGNKQLSNNTLVTGLALHRVLQRQGAPDPYLVQVDADRLRGEYLRRGYLDVDVRARVERKGDAVTVIYTVEEGVRATTKTVINGLPDSVPEDKVRAELPLVDGKPFDYEPYDLAKPKLMAVIQDAGYAHAQLDANVIADRANHTALVELDYLPGPKCTFGTIEVTGVTGELADAVKNRVGFQPGQVYSAQAIVQTQRNLYGFGRFSTVNVQPDKSSGDVVPVKIAVSESASHEVKLGGGVGIDPQGFEVRGRAGYQVAGWRFERDSFRNVSPVLEANPDVLALLKIDRANQVGAYEQALVADLRDHPLEPRLGAYGELRTLEGTKFAGGNYEFFEIAPEVRGYVPVIAGSVLAARAKYTAIFGDVPAIERLFLGGATTQRGFSERRLAPSAADPMDASVTVPYGGAALIDTSLEARVPITKIRGMPLGGVVFVDGGDVTNQPSALDVTNLHWAAGAGVRLQTAVGPVRLDVAYRLNRRGMNEPDPGTAYTYHLTIGEAF
jgi:outer membrane protein assembly factor BamA